MTFNLHNFEKKLEEIISKYYFFFEKLSKLNFDEEDMLSEYCQLIKKLNAQNIKRVDNKIYQFYLNKFLKYLRNFRRRIGFKIIGKEE